MVQNSKGYHMYLYATQGIMLHFQDIVIKQIQ